MSLTPNKLLQKLEERKQQNAFRLLGNTSNLIDFSSNDYLGFANSELIFDAAHKYLLDKGTKQNGSTGSRLLTGNHSLYIEVEAMLCQFHNSEAALIFNSGYDANLGFFASVPQRNDIILFDEFSHASIRDGIVLSLAKSYKFKHNDLNDIQSCLERSREVSAGNTIYVVTESVFSMDGDTPDLKAIVDLCLQYNAFVIVDEAHAIGVFGEQGSGLIQALEIEDNIFARLITFGKAIGCHGAAILGSQQLKDYLINFSRSIIYTTALPPHSLATIYSAYSEITGLNENKESSFEKLQKNITFFKREIISNKLQNHFIESQSAIQCCIISGNKNVKNIAEQLYDQGFNIKAILSPTVPEGFERLRFCLHSYNSEEEIAKVLIVLATFVK